MLQQRRRIGAVAAGIAVQRDLAGCGRIADHCAEAVGLVLLAGDRHHAAWCAEAAFGNRNRGCAALELDHRAGRERVGAASVEQHDGHWHFRLQFGDQRRDRHQCLVGFVERRHIGIDRHQEVFAAGLDAVARIVDHRNVGAFSILDEARQAF